MKLASPLAGACLCLLLAAAGPAALARTTDTSFYEDLGGKEGIRRIVGDFLVLVRADERIKKSFEDADMKRLDSKLQEQLCQLSGGPCTYTGHDMQSSHEDLKISNAQFNAAAEDMQLAMEKNGIPTRAQNKLLARLAPMQRDIVTR